MAVSPTKPLPIPRRRLQATEEVTHKHPRGDAAVLGAGEMDGSIGHDDMIFQIPNMLARIPTVAPRGRLGGVAARAYGRIRYNAKRYILFG